LLLAILHVNNVALQYLDYIVVTAIILWVPPLIILVMGAWLRKKRYRALRRLDPAEKAILWEFFKAQRNTMSLYVETTAVAGLLKKGILLKVAEQGEDMLWGKRFPFAIAEDVRRRLEKNPELMDSLGEKQEPKA